MREDYDVYLFLRYCKHIDDISFKEVDEKACSLAEYCDSQFFDYPMRSHHKCIGVIPVVTFLRVRVLSTYE